MNKFNFLIIISSQIIFQIILFYLGELFPSIYMGGNFCSEFKSQVIPSYVTPKKGLNESQSHFDTTGVVFLTRS